MITYKARENNIVSSQAELQQSIINTLNIFFNAFIGKLEYKLHLVSSITTQDGSTQNASAIQVQTGTYKDGRPKYKTIVNRFAVIDVYLTLPLQSKKKLTRLSLAPVNILGYKPTNAELDILSQNIGSILNNGIINIQTPQTPTPTNQTTPTNTPPTAPPPPPASIRINFGATLPLDIKLSTFNQFVDMVRAGTHTPAEASDALYDYIKKTVEAAGGSSQVAGLVILDSYGLNANQYGQLATDNARGAIASVIQAEATKPVPQQTSGKPGENTLTLLEYYTALKTPLPTVAERALIYEKFGLGPAPTYVGAVEQNIDLLAKLKAQ